jgi:hypothetical protein
VPQPQRLSSGLTAYRRFSKRLFSSHLFRKLLREDEA